jgi:hypothetical protein
MTILNDIKIDSLNRNNVVMAKNCFKKEDLNNENHILEIICGSLTAKYKDFTFTINNSDDLPNWINAIVPLNSFRIHFNFVNKLSHDADEGDFLTFPSDTGFNIDGNSYSIKTYKVYYYPKIKKTEGLNKYSIRATLQDNYNIEVYANTEDEALQKAYNIPLPEWNHEEIDERPEKMKIIRWSRWGNFKII